MYVQALNRFRSDCVSGGVPDSIVEKVVRYGPSSLPEYLGHRESVGLTFFKFRVQVGSVRHILEIPLLKPVPPRRASVFEQLLEITLPLANQDEIIGDLLERYELDITPTRSRFMARAWLWRHAIGAIWTGWRLRRLAFGTMLLQIFHDLMRRI